MKKLNGEIKLKSLALKQVPLVTLIGAISYLFAYFFQVGYSYQYGFPAEFIDVDLNVMLETSGALVLVFVFSINIYNGFRIIHGKYSIFVVVAISYFVLAACLLSSKQFYNVFLVVTEQKYFVLLSFCSAYFFVLSRSRTIISVFCGRADWHDSIFVPLYLMLFSSLCGAFYTMLPTRGFVTSDNYVVISSYGNSIVLGQCNSKQAIFKIRKKTDSSDLRKMDREDLKSFRECLWNKGNNLRLG